MSALEGRRSRYPRKVGFHQTWSLVILEAGFHFVPERHAIVARRFIAGFGHPYDLRTGGTLEVGSRLLRIRRPTPWGQVKCRQCVKSLGRQAIRETVVRERSNLTGHRRSRDQEKWVSIKSGVWPFWKPVFTSSQRGLSDFGRKWAFFVFLDHQNSLPTL
jgi:hypothetical protein